MTCRDKENSNKVASFLCSTYKIHLAFRRQHGFKNQTLFMTQTLFAQFFTVICSFRHSLDRVPITILVLGHLVWIHIYSILQPLMSKDFGSDSSLTRPIWACYHYKYRTMRSLLHSLNGCSSLPEFFKISLCSLFVCFLGILGCLTHQLRQNLVGRLFHTCQFICVDTHIVVFYFCRCKDRKDINTFQIIQEFFINYPTSNATFAFTSSKVISKIA